MPSARSPKPGAMIAPGWAISSSATSASVVSSSAATDAACSSERRVTRLSLEHAASVAGLLLTTEALVAEELIAQPGAIIAPGFGDLAEGLARPSSPV